MSKSRRCQEGFTLIELMIVIGIVAILMALAVPAYQDYSIRSKVGECINMAAAPKVAISEYRQSLGAFPPDAEAAATTNSSDTPFCNGIVYPGGAGPGSFAILVDEAEVGAPAGTIEPLLVATAEASGDVNWGCHRGNTSLTHLKFLPQSCRDE